tara:strand:- start:2845 stop:3486 length:642 start_codon:yes stop_codon:yes gene_type:complete
MKLTDFDRIKTDSADDQIFYNQPRYVNHLSLPFRNRLTNLYSEYLFSHNVILDLMSSWVSHLPNNIKFKKVIGHGLNQDELIMNNRLDSFWIQNLNKTQNLPLEDSIVDVCLIVAGWQYLQYPEKVSLELSRIIKSSSLLIISFTNRAFWTKAPNIWTNSSEKQRIEYVTGVLSGNGWRIEKTINEKTYEKHLFGIHQAKSDPFYSIVARNNK